MRKKKSFNEIISEDLRGKWCDGLAILDVSDNKISIDNIYDNNEKEIGISNYPILRKEKVFFKVMSMSYEEAIKEFTENKKSIVSPKVSTKEIITFDGFKSIRYGGNVYCNMQNNKIIVNDAHKFESLDEILGFGFISEEEIKGKWLVF